MTPRQSKKPVLKQIKKKEKPVKAEKVEKAEKVDKVEKKERAGHRYFFGTGRRKTARTKIKLFMDGNGEITINKRKFEDYFPTDTLQTAASAPLTTLGIMGKVNIEASAAGGGVLSQATAFSLGLSRALLLHNPEHRATLKKQGLLTRDSRKKERKKPGLKRARRAPQWQKR